MARTKAKQEPAPDRRPITDLQAERLAALTDLSVKDLAGLSVAELSLARGSFVVTNKPVV